MGSILLISYVGLTNKYSYNKARLISIFYNHFLNPNGLLGYRTQVVFVLLGSLICGSMIGIWKKSELILLIAISIGSLFFLTMVRDTILGVNLSLIESLKTRISLTTDVMDILANMGGVFGLTNGAIHISTHPFLARLMPGVAYSPRRMMAVLVGEKSISVTSSIFGPLSIDFGLIGVIISMAFLGFLSSLYNSADKENGEGKLFLLDYIVWY